MAMTCFEVNADVLDTQMNEAYSFFA